MLRNTCIVDFFHKMDQYPVFYSLTFLFGASFSGAKPDFICTKNIGKRYFGRATLAEPRWPGREGRAHLPSARLVSGIHWLCALRLSQQVLTITDT